MKAFGLYLRYALRSFIRGRTRSLFGAFCIAVGVASVVALGLVGANFTSALTKSGQVLNRGDVSVTSTRAGLDFQQYRYFAQLKAQGRITDYTAIATTEAQLSKVGGDPNDTLLGSMNAVDPKKFPFYGTVTADTPSGSSLATLLRNPDAAVVGHDVFDGLHLHIGDRIQVTTTETTSIHLVYTVTGIIPDSAVSPGAQAVQLGGNVMVDRAGALPVLRAQNRAASEVFMKTRDAAQAVAVKKAIERQFGSLNTTQTAADAQKSTQDSVGLIDKFFHIMGLVAVIIGGIGIINTMLVAARRRTKEIAVLKSLGMKGRQVVVVFVTEAALLALAGILLGVPLGVLVSLVVNNVTQNLFTGAKITWSLHPEPLIAGVLVGLVATLLFSYLPILRASKARPVAALRSETVGLPKQGWFRTLVLVLGLAAVMGYLGVVYAGLASGFQALEYGVPAGIGTLVGAALLTQLFVFVVWSISKLPSMGRLSVRMALRSMGTQKRRLSSTLLALCIGIFAVGSVVLLAQGFSQALTQAAVKEQSFNVVVYSSSDAAHLRRVDAELARLPGIQHREDGAYADQISLRTVDGKPVGPLLQRALSKRGAIKKDVVQAAQYMRGVGGRDLRITTTNVQIETGRNLNQSDVGTDHMLVKQEMADTLGIKVGSRLMFQEGSHRVPFTVVGIQKTANISVSFLGTNVTDVSYMRRAGLTTPSPGHTSAILLRIRDERVQSDVSQLRRRLPGNLVLDVNALVGQITQLLNQFTLFPEIIAAMALFAGAIIIANTVALAMLERRREIGVIKAVGAKRRTILQFLLVENAVVGFLGALMGALLAYGAVAFVAQYLGGMSVGFNPIAMSGLVLLGVALALGASSLTALPASSEKPMSVLRYE